MRSCRGTGSGFWHRASPGASTLSTRRIELASCAELDGMLLGLVGCMPLTPRFFGCFCGRHGGLPIGWSGGLLRLKTVRRWELVGCGGARVAADEPIWCEHVTRRHVHGIQSPPHLFLRLPISKSVCQIRDPSNESSCCLILPIAGLDTAFARLHHFALALSIISVTSWRPAVPAESSYLVSPTTCVR